MTCHDAPAVVGVGAFSRICFQQLRDAKIKPRVETFRSTEMPIFAEWCGQSLARSHARSCETAMIGGYLGESESFGTAIAAFSGAYADQIQPDHAALKKAARQKRMEVMIEGEE